MPANVCVPPSFGVCLSALPVGVGVYLVHICCLLSTGFERPVGLAVVLLCVCINRVTTVRRQLGDVDTDGKIILGRISKETRRSGKN
jgi:hypothetical protein